MSRAWLIAVNNLRRLVRQPVMLFTTLALPFAIITIIGVALGGSAETPRVGVVSLAHDPMGRELVHGIQAAPALDTIAYDDEAALRRAVRRGQVAAGVVVPAGYGDLLPAGREAVVRFVTTPRQDAAPTVRSVVQSLISEQVATLQAGQFSAAQTGRPAAGELKRAAELSPGVERAGVRVEAVAKDDAMRLGFDYTGPSNLTLFTILTSLTSAAALIETRQSGVLRRLFAMPAGRGAVLGGEFLGRIVVAVAQAAVIWAFCALVFRVEWGSPLAVAVLTGSLCLFGAAAGLLVGFLARTTAQAIAIGPPVGVALGMLGGCMWPLSITGDAMTAVGHVTPHAWAMDGYITLINTGGGLTSVVTPVLVTGGMGLAVLLAAALVIRKAGVQ
ncbi:ABC transporter permease [Streptomyces sp. NPDC051940]|uniref:ABC transporter permease n=1 Tax=Streptomyces sp. NPDC051940 TaxID=3155675 RepID=UPI00344076B4